MSTTYPSDLTFSVGAQAPALRHGESAVSPLCALRCVHGSVLAASSDAAPRAVGPGRPVRRQRGPLGRASPEHPPPSGVGSVNKTRNGNWKASRSPRSLPLLGQKAPPFRAGDEWPLARRRAVVVVHSAQFFCTCPTECCFSGSAVNRSCG